MTTRRESGNGALLAWTEYVQSVDLGELVLDDDVGEKPSEIYIEESPHICHCVRRGHEVCFEDFVAPGWACAEDTPDWDAELFAYELEQGTRLGKMQFWNRERLLKGATWLLRKIKFLKNRTYMFFAVRWIQGLENAQNGKDDPWQLFRESATKSPKEYSIFRRAMQQEGYMRPYKKELNPAKELIPHNPHQMA